MTAHTTPERAVSRRCRSTKDWDGRLLFQCQDTQGHPGHHQAEQRHPDGGWMLVTWPIWREWQLARSIERRSRS